MAKAHAIEGIDRTSTVADAASATLSTRSDEVAHYLAAATDRADIENLHAIRVALRRLRAGMQAYKSAYADFGGWEGLREEVSVLFRATSPLRDADVQREHVAALAATAPPATGPGFTLVTDTIRSRAKPLEADVERAVAAWKTTDVLGRLRATVATTPQDTRPAAKLASKRLAKRLGQVRDALDTAERTITDVGPDGSATLAAADPESLHHLRITIKKLRYTAELFAPVMKPKLGRLADELGDLQDVLGDIHDTDVLAADLVELTGTLDPADAAMVGVAYILGDTVATGALRHRELEAQWPVERLRALDEAVAKAT